MIPARDASCRGWRAALILAAGFGPALAFSSFASTGELPVPLQTRPEIQRLVVNEAVANGTVPAPLALAVAEVSSDFVPRTVGTSGAMGIMQLDPEVAQSEFGITAESLWDPATNVRLGLQYLSRLHSRYYGDWELALSHFRGGPLLWMNGTYVPQDFTLEWSQRVMRHWRFYQREPLVRAWTREARGGGSRFRWYETPRYHEPGAPYHHTYVRWPCVCERCWNSRSQWQRTRHCDDPVVELPRPGGRHRFNGSGIRWTAIEAGGWSPGYRSGPWVAITGGPRFK